MRKKDDPVVPLWYLALMLVAAILILVSMGYGDGQIYRLPDATDYIAIIFIFWLAPGIMASAYGIRRAEEYAGEKLPRNLKVLLASTAICGWINVLIVWCSVKMALRWLQKEQ